MLKVENIGIKDGNYSLVHCNTPVSIAVDNSIVDYKIYKQDPDYIRKGQDESIDALNLLNNLGYPMDLVGTHLYKDMILVAKDKLLTAFDDDVLKSQLKEEMESPYSQFYFDIARNELDIGIKTFHSYIAQAVDNIDYNRVNENLSQAIYGDDSNSQISVLKNAYLIADYLAKEEVNRQNNGQVKVLVLNTEDAKVNSIV